MTLSLGFTGEIVKLSAAGVCFALWVVGNHRRMGWHAEWIVLSLTIIAAIGLVMAVAGATF